MTDLRKAYPYGWTRKPTYEELDQIFDRCRELHQKAEKKLDVLEKLVEDWLPQIGMTITFREMFYEILDKPNPDWLGERQLTNVELKWIAEAMTVREEKG